MVYDLGPGDPFTFDYRWEAACSVNAGSAQAEPWTCQINLTMLILLR